MREEDP
jgi:hypothetical protein